MLCGLYSTLLFLSPPCPCPTTTAPPLKQELCADPSNVVVIFSGSECSKLEDTFGDLPLWLVAENGVYVRPPAASGLPEVWGGWG